jgi:hypothetical protein
MKYRNPVKVLDELYRSGFVTDDDFRKVNVSAAQIAEPTLDQVYEALEAHIHIIEKSKH